MATYTPISMQSTNAHLVRLFTLKKRSNNGTSSTHPINNNSTRADIEQEFLALPIQTSGLALPKCPSLHPNPADQTEVQWLPQAVT